MDDITWILLGALVVLGLPILAISAFVMALGLRTRVSQLEARLGALQEVLAERPPSAPVAAAEALPGPEAPAEPEPAAEEQVPAAAPEAPAEPAEPIPAEAEPAEAEPNAHPPRPARPPVSLEERLGARWAVWVGGLALALGGVFLVRYSIDEGLLGPGVRVALGLVFALGLVAAGEWLRRRGPVPEEAGRNAYVPGVLTAAGAAALFATVYAAHALYDFIGPAAAFVALGLVALLAMAAALLHGPWLAGLGLVGAYATPLLVDSHSTDRWPLVLYLAVVTAAAFALARLRLWRWLALTATFAALAWGFVLFGEPIFAFGRVPDLTPALTHVLALAALVLAVLVVEPHIGRAGFGGFDAVALVALAGVAALALAGVYVAEFSSLGLAVAWIVAAGLLAAALAFEAVAPAAGVAALLALGVVLSWPVAAEIAAEPITVVPERLVSPPLVPQALSFYLTMAGLSGLALFAGTTGVLLRRAMVVPPAVALALAGTAGPLLLLACAYVRATSFSQSIPYGLVALAAAAILAASTDRLLRSAATHDAPGQGAAAAVHAAGTCAALALALTMTLEGSPLTLAFALASLGAAWVSGQRPLAALRWSAAALALLVLTRMGGAWTVIGEALTTFPGWGDIALRYAVPCLAVGLAGRLLRRQAADLPAAILDGGAIVLGTAAAALAIRLWVTGPQDALTAEVGLAEAGLYVALAFGVAIGFARGALTTTSVVHRLAAPLSTFAAVALAVLDPILGLNPAVTGVPVAGGPVVNVLLLGYAFPAVLAFVAARTWQRIRVRGEGPAVPLAGALAQAAAATGLVLAFLYVTLETHVLVSGPLVDLLSMSDAQSYAYSAVWLVFGIALLAAGLAFGSKGARLASALVILLTVAKVFILDLSGLEGVWRALSFMGLGAVLIGIGLVYQRLLFGASPRGGKAAAARAGPEDGGK